MSLSCRPEQVQNVIYAAKGFSQTHNNQFQLKSQNEKPITHYFLLCPTLFQPLSLDWVIVLLIFLCHLEDSILFFKNSSNKVRGFYLKTVRFGIPRKTHSSLLKAECWDE